MSKKYFGENSTNFLIAILKSELETKIDKINIANDFETDDSNKVLSAAKGKELYDIVKDLTKIDLENDIKSVIGCYCVTSTNEYGVSQYNFYSDSEHLNPLSLVSGKFYLDFHKNDLYLYCNDITLNVYTPEIEITDDEIYTMWYDGSFMFYINDDNGTFHLVALRNTTWGDWLTTEFNNGNFSSDNLNHVLMGAYHVGYMKDEAFIPLFTTDVIKQDIDYIISTTYSHVTDRTLKITTNIGSNVKIEKINSENESYVDPDPIIIESTTNKDTMVNVTFGTYKVTSTTVIEGRTITNTDTITIGNEEVIYSIEVANYITNILKVTTNVGSKVKVELIKENDVSYVDPDPVIIESTTEELTTINLEPGTYKITSTTTFDGEDIYNSDTITISIEENEYAVTITNEAPIKRNLKITTNVGVSLKIELTKSDDTSYVDPNPVEINSTTEDDTTIALKPGDYKVTATNTDNKIATATVTIGEEDQEYTVSLTEFLPVGS